MGLIALRQSPSEIELIFEIVFSSGVIGSRPCYPIGLARLTSHLDQAAVGRHGDPLCNRLRPREHAGLVPELVMLIVHRPSAMN